MHDPQSFCFSVVWGKDIVLNTHAISIWWQRVKNAKTVSFEIRNQEKKYGKHAMGGGFVFSFVDVLVWMDQFDVAM